MTEKSSLDDISKAQEAVNKQLLGRILLQTQEAEIAKIVQNAAAAQKDLLLIEIERTKLQKDFTGTAELAAQKREQLNQRESLANSLLDKQKNDLGKLNEQYQELAKSLGVDLSVQNHLTKSIEDTSKAAEEASKKLEQLRIDSEQKAHASKAGDDPIKKLDAEYDAALQSAVRLFGISQKSAADRTNLAATLAAIEIAFENKVSDETIRISTETQRKLNELNSKNREEDLKATLETLEGEKQKAHKG